MCLFLMCSCDNHDFELSEKEQVFTSPNAVFSIEPWDSLSKAYSYDFSYETRNHARKLTPFI